MSQPSLNHLLNALPLQEFQRLQPDLKLISLSVGDVLYESIDPMQYAYFPSTAIVSLLYVLENGASAETAVIGNEGLVGVSLFMGGQTTPSRAIVRTEGEAYRIKASLLLDEFHKCGATQHLLLRYTQALMTQTTQTAVCNRHHTVEQQLCRWLLLNLDRLPDNSMDMTQDMIAGMLGVRREGVTEAAGKLQREDIIKYSRGHIEVLDRPSLEKKVCECYEVVKTEFDRLLPVEDERV